MKLPVPPVPPEVLVALGFPADVKLTFLDGASVPEEHRGSSPMTSAIVISIEEEDESK